MPPKQNERTQRKTRRTHKLNEKAPDFVRGSLLFWSSIGLCIFQIPCFFAGASLQLALDFCVAGLEQIYQLVASYVDAALTTPCVCANEADTFSLYLE